MTYDHKPPAPMPLIEVAAMLARSGKWQCAAAVRDAKDRIAELERENAELRAIVDAIQEGNRVGVIKVLCCDPSNFEACLAAQQVLHDILSARVAAV